jgi:hypothetical protein
MEVYWSKMAKIDFWDNIEYLEEKWSISEVNQFIDKTEHLIDLLKKGDVHFKPTAYLNTFQVPVLHQITLYYRVQNDTIELLRFWNNYQNLNKPRL